MEYKDDQLSEIIGYLEDNRRKLWYF